MREIPISVRALAGEPLAGCVEESGVAKGATRLCPLQDRPLGRGPWALSCSCEVPSEASFAKRGVAASCFFFGFIAGTHNIPCIPMLCRPCNSRSLNTSMLTGL